MWDLQGRWNTEWKTMNCYLENSASITGARFYPPPCAPRKYDVIVASLEIDHECSCHPEHPSSLRESMAQQPHVSDQAAPPSGTQYPVSDISISCV